MLVEKGESIRVEDQNTCFLASDASGNLVFVDTFNKEVAVKKQKAHIAQKRSELKQNKKALHDRMDELARYGSGLWGEL